MNIPQSVQAIDRQTAEVYRLREQNTELLAACKAVEPIVVIWIGYREYLSIKGSALEKLWNAIKSAEKSGRT